MLLSVAVLEVGLGLQATFQGSRSRLGLRGLSTGSGLGPDGLDGQGVLHPDQSIEFKIDTGHDFFFFWYFPLIYKVLVWSLVSLLSSLDKALVSAGDVLTPTLVLLRGDEVLRLLLSCVISVPHVERFLGSRQLREQIAGSIDSSII